MTCAIKTPKTCLQLSNAGLNIREKEKTEPFSKTPDHGPDNGQNSQAIQTLGSRRSGLELRDQALSILHHLNEKAGRNFQGVDPILALLKTGTTVSDCMAMIDAKCADPLYFKIRPYWLEPKTMFGASVFEKYRTKHPEIFNGNVRQAGPETYDLTDEELEEIFGGGPPRPEVATACPF